MVLYSKKDFSDKCGLKSKDLSIYIKRGKVIPSGDYIDDAIEQNRDFLFKWSEKKNDKVLEEVVPVKEIKAEDKKNTISKLKHSKPVYPKQKIPNVKSPERTEEENSIYTTEKALKSANLRKVNADTEYRTLQIEKLRGELIPTDLARSFVVHHSESIKIAFNEAVDKHIIIISSKKQFSADEIADTRKELTTIVNKAIDNAIAITNRSIKNIVMEYSNVKGVGEHG